MKLLKKQQNKIKQYDCCLKKAEVEMSRKVVLSCCYCNSCSGCGITVGCGSIFIKLMGEVGLYQNVAQYCMDLVVSSNHRM